MSGNFRFYNPKYEDKKKSLTEFITNFAQKESSKDNSQQFHGDLKYMNILQKVANRQQTRVDILMEDLEEYFSSQNDRPLIEAIQKNTSRFVSFLSQICDDQMPARNSPLSEDEELQNIDQIINEQRSSNMEGNQNKDDNPKNKLNPLLNRKFQLFITRGSESKDENIPIRKLKSDDIGRLVTISAIVIRVTDVKPMMQVACYICDTCGCELYQQVNCKSFTPLKECVSETCKTNRTKGKVVIHTSSCIFQSYQEIRVQEVSEHVPQGNIPRRFLILAMGENVRQCSPGDQVTVQGVYLPTQSEDMRGQSNLIMETYLEAYSIIKKKKNYLNIEYNEDIQVKVKDMKENMNCEQIYDTLSKSIAPEIFGMENIKKALLLLMIGGSTLEMNDGMRIRGDINIAMIGDPGVAKSQLLKHIARISPRGIYTTGKGSSGVGLTASLIKDPITKEMSLEGGALVLADMGVCCIDEFDKMNEYDRTSIHEVMEQQTVSIAKAGMATSLNARTSILAAANPLYGRYNKKMSPHQNINLPAALLSRFDLVFIMLDNHEDDKDIKLAKHICEVHKTFKHPKQDFEIVDTKVISAFVSEARKYQPTINKQLHQFLVDRYLEQRSEQSKNEGYSYTTPRTLLGIIRLAQALAKLRFSDAVSQNDVDEALRLMQESQSSVNQNTENSNQSKPYNDKISSIYGIIKQECKKERNLTVSFSEVEKIILARGFTNEDIQRTLNIYESMDAIMINNNKSQIVLVRYFD